jgi:mannose-6-phosphate isomerase
LAAAQPAAIVGRRGQAVTGGRAHFPLLVKLIDAVDNLSIQVHPDDTAAQSRDRLGKTEAWHVLAAAPGAVLYLGLRPGVSLTEFAEACRWGNGEAAAYLRQVEAIPGTTLLIPAGTVHALGAGILVYEVQQPSDVTYRLDDWGRVDAAGQRRELHVDAGLAVLNQAMRPELIPPIDLGNGRQLVVACRYFALERLSLGRGEEVILSISGPDSPQVLTCLQGAAELTANGDRVGLIAGGTVVAAAASPTIHVRALVPTILMRAWVPDLESEIVRPARARGAPDKSIACLVGALP